MIKNMSRIVKNYEDLSKSEIGERISVGIDGPVGILVLTHEKVYSEEVMFCIKDSSEEYYHYITDKNKIKQLPFVR